MVEKKPAVEAIPALFEVYASSLMAGDIDRWIALWEEDGIQLPPGVPMIVGKQAIYESQSEWLNQRSISNLKLIGDFEIQEFGDWAYSMANYTYQATPKDGSPSYVFDGKVLTILHRQQNGEWKIYRDCFSPNTA